MFLLGKGATHLTTGLETVGDVTPVTVDRFPDDELYVQLPDTLPGHVYYVQSFYPDPNTRVLETLLTFDAFTETSTRVTPVFPYFPYAKQDEIFQPGEPLSVRAVLHAFRSRGMEQPVFVNTHFLKEPGEHDRFNVSCTNTNAAPHLLDEVIANEELTDPVVVLPGGGAQHLLPDWEGETVTVQTERETGDNDGFRNVAHTVLTDADAVTGRDVVVLDDMIATGGTMTETCKTVQEADADRVVAAAVHGLCIGDAVEQVTRYTDKVYTTDTVPQPGNVDIVPVSPVLGTVPE